MKRQKPKVFVLDTCVYGHDPNAIFSFEEHDLHVPIVVMRELDGHKSNYKKPELARNARQISRYFLELLRGANPKDMEKGFPISLIKSHYGKNGPDKKTGRVFFETTTPDQLISSVYPDGAIINYTKKLQEKLGEKVEVIFVTQDINAFSTSLICGVQTEEYESGKALDDIDLLYNGMYQLPSGFWEMIEIEMTAKSEGISYWNIKTPLARNWYPNQFLYLTKEDSTEEYIVDKVDGETASIRTIIDYRKLENGVWGLHPLNKEQNFALNALMNPEIDFVSLAGKAGSGKTLLALAAALEQVMAVPKIYSKILITKEAMPIGEDLGFFPGTEEQKMAPWMMAFTDNLDFLCSGMNEGVMKQSAKDLMKNYIEMRAIGPMQGRTFHKKFVILDEAQNLAPKQMLDLITRAGPGTKFVCLGNIKQIATPYLTGEASGLTSVVEAFKTWERSAHVTLVAGERSPLAEFASNNLCQ
ncbi:MAG: PhoH family protein [Candidatus Parcubacteria bacterium]|nr:PhoH family protein [Candidatus Parcubacteria bacterium]